VQLTDENGAELGLQLWYILLATSELGRRDSDENTSSPHNVTGALMLYRTSIGRGRVAEEVLGLIAAELERGFGCSEAVTSECCSGIARWAEERSCWGTAFLFAREAARLQPGNAYAAYEAGRLAIRGSSLSSAEACFSVARSASQQDADWEVYLWTQIEFGVVASQRGNTKLAQGLLMEAAHEAERFGFVNARAEAFHGLALLAFQNRSFPAAELYVRAALHVPTKRNRRKELFRTLAMIMLERGKREPAVRLLKKVVASSDTLPDRAVTVALLAVAAAADRTRVSYERYWERAWNLIETAAEPVSAALLRLAQASVAYSDWARLHRVQTYHARSVYRDPLLSAALKEIFDQAERLQ
jgi:tetratricopeptide (TPR) repeat protein